MEQTKYKLTYFNLKAIAEPIRYIFHYTNTEFEDERVDRVNWPALKDSYPWSILPLLEETIGTKQNKLSQSFAIGRYLGKKFHMAGQNNYESAKCDEYGDALKDLLAEVRPLFVETDETKKAELRENIVNVQIPKYFGKFAGDLERNGNKRYIVGNQYTWIDFFVAHYVDFLESYVNLNLEESYPALKVYTSNILNLPQIKEWIEVRPVTPM